MLLKHNPGSARKEKLTATQQKTLILKLAKSCLSPGEMQLLRRKRRNPSPSKTKRCHMMKYEGGKNRKCVLFEGHPGEHRYVRMPKKRANPKKRFLRCKGKMQYVDGTSKQCLLVAGHTGGHTYTNPHERRINCKNPKAYFPKSTRGRKSSGHFRISTYDSRGANIANVRMKASATDARCAAKALVGATQRGKRVQRVVLDDGNR